MENYQAPIIRSLISFYGNLLFANSNDSIYEYLNRLACKMYKGILQNEDCVFTQINNYHPDYLGISASKLKEFDFDLSMCQQTIANEYNYYSWEEIKRLSNTKINIEFEHCIGLILNGDVQSLKQSIITNPYLIKHRSQFGHNATLLHYCASNGVELWRQQVPCNLIEIIKFLLQAGANKNAKMNIYGGHFKTVELLSTSDHPFEIGLGNAAMDILKDPMLS